MNEAAYISFMALFIAGAPVLLAVRLLQPWRMPWWLLLVLVAILGWVFSNLAVHFYYRHLNELLAQAGGVEGASQDLVDRWQNDGAKRVFAFFFGWLYGLIYLVPWLVVYFVARKIKTARSRAAA